MAVEKKDAAFALAKNVLNIKYGDIQHKAIEVTKTDILDTLGVAIAASTTTPACKEMAELAMYKTTLVTNEYNLHHSYNGMG